MPKAKSPVANIKSSVGDIISTIEKLTVLELAELVDALKERFGVSGAPMAVAAPTTDGAAMAQAAVAEQTEFDVVLTEIGPNKIPVIKVVRQVTGLGLKEAKAVVDGAPGPVKQGVSKEEAGEIVKQLQAEGAKAEIK